MTFSFRGAPGRCCTSCDNCLDKKAAAAATLIVPAGIFAGDPGSDCDPFAGTFSLDHVTDPDCACFWCIGGDLGAFPLSSTSGAYGAQWVVGAIFNAGTGLYRFGAVLTIQAPFPDSATATWLGPAQGTALDCQSASNVALAFDAADSGNSGTTCFAPTGPVGLADLTLHF